MIICCTCPRRGHGDDSDRNSHPHLISRASLHLSCRYDFHAI